MIWLFLLLSGTIHAYHGLHLGMTRGQYEVMLQKQQLWTQGSVFSTASSKVTILLNPQKKAKILYKTGVIRVANLMFESDTLASIILFGENHIPTVKNTKWAEKLGDWFAESISVFNLPSNSIAEKMTEVLTKFEVGYEHEKTLISEKTSATTITSLYILHKEIKGKLTMSGLIVIRPIGSEEP